MIAEHLREWTLERLPAVDRAVLRAGAWELLFGTQETDSAIVIDQSVLLVADLSEEKSIPYVNAVLDRVAGLADHIRAAEQAVSVLDPASGVGAPAESDQSTSSSPDTGTDAPVVETTEDSARVDSDVSQTTSSEQSSGSAD